MYSVSIDAGGTMTDAIVAGNGKLVTLKVDSTPHDLTVSLMNCLSEAGGDLGYDRLTDFLSDVEVIRWSSTVTSNVLGELKGAKVGIIVAEGAEETLYGESPSPAVGSIVKRENIIGIGAHVDAPRLMESVKSMLRRGVRRICIALPGSVPDNTEERRLKAIINEQYPDHFVGSVPVVLGSEITQTRDDLTRAHYAVLNAYVHPPLAASLFKCEDRLKQEASWNGPLLIGHTNGGVARVGKTRAIDTIESGPVFGLFGAASFARLYGERIVMSLDVGGTTAKASIVSEGKPVFWRSGDLFGIPTSNPIALLRSCSTGGGSVASCAGELDSLQVGPKSMGASPGPACYGLGGASATLTDAFIVLGYVDPQGFYGGRKVLDVKLAAGAIDQHIARPSGTSTEIAALALRDKAVAQVSALAAETAGMFGAATGDMTLFATGGNGPLFAPFVAERLGMRRVYVFFALGPVFSAFGCNTSDVTHAYRKSVETPLASPAAAGALMEAVSDLRARAEMDLAGEGFDPGAAKFMAEFDVQNAGQKVFGVSFGLDDPTMDLVAATEAACANAGVAPGDGGELTVQAVGLRTEYALPSVSFDELASRGGDGNGEARPGSSRTLWLSGEAIEAPVYDWTGLAGGQTIEGPAVVSGGNTSCIVPTGWTLTVDRYGNGLMSR